MYIAFFMVHNKRLNFTDFNVLNFFHVHITIKE